MSWEVAVVVALSTGRPYSWSGPLLSGAKRRSPPSAPTPYLVRLKLSPAGYALMESILGRLNWLYNQALERRRTAHQEREESLSFYDQCQWLTQMRAVNAALNILAAGVIALGGQTWAVGPCVAPELCAETA